MHVVEYLVGTSRFFCELHDDLFDLVNGIQLAIPVQNSMVGTGRFLLWIEIIIRGAHQLSCCGVVIEQLCGRAHARHAGRRRDWLISEPKKKYLKY